MINFSSFLKRNFTTSPRKVVGIVFVFCFCIDFFIAFQYAPFEFDWYYYSPNGQLNIYKVYLAYSSEIATTYVGSIFAIVVFAIKDGLTLAISLALNVISFIQMRKHLSKKQLLVSSYNNERPLPIVSTTQIARNEKKRIYERNMLLMVTSVCLFSCLTKTTTLICNIYWLFTYDLIAVILGLAGDIFIALNSTVPFLIYLSFNHKFRKAVFNKLGLIRRHVKVSQSTGFTRNTR
jgi:hypothetical protein